MVEPRRHHADDENRVIVDDDGAADSLRVGVQPPAASWGSMLYQAQSTLSTEPWLALFPGVFILATTLSVNVVGDELARPKL